MSRLCTIGEAARLLGVSIPTLRRWEESGKLVPERTAGKHRRYDITKLKPELAIADTTRTTIAYARVSSHDQREDLERQKQVLELYCAQHGWNFTLLSDLGSGMNYHKKGLRRLLDAILSGDVGRLVITHKDRLLRFGAELVFAICEWGGRSPWLWAKAAGGHLWRTTYDSRDGWHSGDHNLTGIMDIFDSQEGLERYAAPGAWNDPDLLMVGLYGKGKSSSPDSRFAGCTDEEYKSHFALWCMLAAPLIVNNDLRNMSEFTRQLLTNRHLIAIDQDSLGRQGYTFMRSDSLQYLRKELSNGVAICVFNRAATPQPFTFDPVKDADILYPADVTNAWTGTVSRKGTLRGTLPPHGCEVYIYQRKAK